MASGLVGKKLGMTRIFEEDGRSVPVTVLEILPNRVTQVKTVETDGYNAIQVTTGNIKAKNVNKASAGHFNGVEPGRGLWEFPIGEGHEEMTRGSEITLDKVFSKGQFVKVTGTSKGKGYAGTVKRWNFRTQDATHGNSLAHRVPGSIGQNQTPGRVFKGKKMSGHLGDETCSVKNLEIVRIDTGKQVIMVKGAVPGATGSDVIVNPVKANSKQSV